MDCLATEVQLHILAFAGPRTACVFGGCNRAAYRLVAENDATIFRPPTVAQRFVSAAGPCSSVTDADNQRVIIDLKRCLELKSWRDMWETTTHIIRPPWVGYYRAIPAEPFDNEEDTRGTLDACVVVDRGREFMPLVAML